MFSSVPNVNGDGGFISVKPADVYESGQNAVIGWDGEVERLILSVNIYADKDTEGFHIIPFPSMPNITEGDLDIFERLQRIGCFQEHQYDSYPLSDGGGSKQSESSVEIMFQDTIGEHSVTTIRVNDPQNFRDKLMEIVDEIGIDIREWPQDLNRILFNYTSRGFNYFSIDRYPIYKKEKTVDPLIYEFETDRLVFPLEISSMLEGDSRIRLALFTDPYQPMDRSVLDSIPKIDMRFETMVPPGILFNIDNDLFRMFMDGAVLNYLEFTLPLSRVRGDVMIREDDYATWSRHSVIPDLIYRDLQIQSPEYYIYDYYNDQTNTYMEIPGSELFLINHMYLHWRVE
ncbi:MAG: DUF2330 domain-containing protein, partial [Thermoplasmatota archaeon]